MKLDRDVPCMCVHVCVSPTKPFDGPSASLKVSKESRAFSRAVKKNSAVRCAPSLIRFATARVVSRGRVER